MWLTLIKGERRWRKSPYVRATDYYVDEYFTALICLLCVMCQLVDANSTQMVEVPGVPSKGVAQSVTRSDSALGQTYRRFLEPQSIRTESNGETERFDRLEDISSVGTESDHQASQDRTMREND
jgi:hypothetical protein